MVQLLDSGAAFPAQHGSYRSTGGFLGLFFLLFTFAVCLIVVKSLIARTCAIGASV